MPTQKENNTQIARSITDLIGGTPLLSPESVNAEMPGTVLLKLESFNPMSSVKDRIAFSIVRAAAERGDITPGDTIVEATSGNTGIGLAFVAASLGYRLIITMPDTMSMERRSLLAAFGAEIHLTPGSEGMPGAIRKADELASSLDGAVRINQFNDPANPDIHRQTTAREIWDDTAGDIDMFVAGVGTGGTITGTGETLKQYNPDIGVYAVEPVDSPVLSGGEPGPHTIQGIGAGFIPDVLNTNVIDEILTVSHSNAIDGVRTLARREGLLCGFSGGAAFSASCRLAQREENTGKTIVTIIPDNGERYLSTTLFTDGQEQRSTL